jgi:hypothetical protein
LYSSFIDIKDLCEIGAFLLSQIKQESMNSNTDLSPDEEGIFVQDGAIFCYGTSEKEWLMMEPIPELVDIPN